MNLLDEYTNNSESIRSNIISQQSKIKELNKKVAAELSNSDERGAAADSQNQTHSGYSTNDESVTNLEVHLLKQRVAQLEKTISKKSLEIQKLNKENTLLKNRKLEKKVKRKLKKAQRFVSQEENTPKKPSKKQSEFVFPLFDFYNNLENLKQYDLQMVEDFLYEMPHPFEWQLSS